jgi:hypothetical protein
VIWISLSGRDRASLSIDAENGDSLWRYGTPRAADVVHSILQIRMEPPRPNTQCTPSASLKGPPYDARHANLKIVCAAERHSLTIVFRERNKQKYHLDMICTRMAVYVQISHYVSQVKKFYQVIPNLSALGA